MYRYDMPALRCIITWPRMMASAFFAHLPLPFIHACPLGALMQNIKSGSSILMTVSLQYIQAYEVEFGKTLPRA
jgi:hypothetical protein